MPGALLDQLLETFPDMEISQGYGMTESSSVLTFLMPEEHRRGGDVLRSAGRPMPGVVLSIQDADGNPVPKGEPGEVCARAGPARRRWPDETTHRFFSQVWRGGNDRGPAWALFFWRWGGHIDDQRALWRVKTLSIDLDDSVAVFLIKLEDPPVEVVASSVMSAGSCRVRRMKRAFLSVSATNEASTSS